MRCLPLLALAAAVSLALPAWAATQPNSHAGRNASVAELFTNTELRIVDVQTGQALGRRFRIVQAALSGRCTLGLRMEPADTRHLRIALGDLRYVQGDGEAMVDVSTRREPRRSLIFTVGPDHYAAVMDGLSTLARRCGAKLVGPPPLVVTTPPR